MTKIGYWARRGAMALALAPAALLAQGTGTENTIGPVTISGDNWAATYDVGEVAAVKSAADGLQTMFGNILGALVPVVGAVLLAGVAVWAIPRIAGLIKSAFSAGKGR